MRIIEKDVVGVYCIRNTVNGNQYIGSSNKVRTRQKLHINQLNAGKHHSIALQRAWTKYGTNVFEFSILEETEVALLLEREQYYLDTLKPAYNICRVAGSTRGRVLTEETRKNMSMSKLGVRHTEERKQKRREARVQSGEKHWTKFKTFSDESKQRMSEAHKRLYANGYVNPGKGVKRPKELAEASRISHTKFYCC